MASGIEDPRRLARAPSSAIAVVSHEMRQAFLNMICRVEQV
jgi:hypothetical protein